MDVRNCKKCGKMFQYVGEAICPECAKEIEKKFMEVKQYIRDNPTASIGEVAEENDIPMSQIKKWIRQERLTFSESSGMTIECEKCGRPILTGRFCKECKNSMSNSLSSLYKSKENTVKKENHKDANGKMRFIK